MNNFKYNGTDYTWIPCNEKYFWEYRGHSSVPVLCVDGEYFRGKAVSNKNYAILTRGQTKGEIYSVRRLSDGEIFMVEDHIKVCDTPRNTYRIWTISEINNELIIKRRGDYQVVNFATIEKVKNPLFTTEDGKLIYEGDNYTSLIAEETVYKEKKFSTEEAANSWVRMNKPEKRIYTTADGFTVLDSDIYPVYKVDKNFNLSQFVARYTDGNSTDATYWVDKSKAENHIYENKPCLSVEDVMRAYIPTHIGYPVEMEKKLKTLVKQRYESNR